MGETSSEIFTEKLKECVENVAGFKMRTRQDFDFLATNIFNETRQMLSATTIKRFWGYLKEKEELKPRVSTFNILARYVGYADFETFCKYQSEGNECESEFILNKCLSARSLFKGDIVKLMWAPDRCVTIQYVGLCMFRVISSRNSKLCENDTFICERIVENTPLLLSNLIHNNGESVNYICGKRGGVKYQLVTK